MGDQYLPLPPVILLPRHLTLTCRVHRGQDVDRADGKTSQYLNIYSDWEPEFGASPLETLAQNWRHVELEFIPYQLQHAVVDISGVLDVRYRGGLDWGGEGVSFG